MNAARELLDDLALIGATVEPRVIGSSFVPVPWRSQQGWSIASARPKPI